MAVHTYSAGTAFLTVVPSFRNIERELGNQVAQMARKVDKAVAGALPKGFAEGARASRGTGERAAQVFSGAYEREAKKRLVQAYQSLPDFDPEIDLTKWQKSVNQLKKDMRELADSKFGPDFDERTFATAVAAFQRRAKELMESTPRLGGDRGFFDLSGAEGELSALSRFVEDAERRGEEAADGFGGAFQKRMREILTRGVGAIPKVQVDADTSEAARKLQQLRTDMEILSNKTIGVDISADDAFDEVRRIHGELDRLDRQNVEVEVRTNARTATADIGAFLAQADGAAAAVNSIGHAANFSMTRLGYLIALGASMGSVLIPGAAAAAAAIGAIGTQAIAAVSGLGVFALGLSGVGDAVKAMNAYEQDRAKSSNSLSQANRRLASSADQVRMAELSLANTRANIADQAFDASQRVAEAQRSVADARRDAQYQLEQSNRQVRDAQRDVTAAEQNAVEVRRSLNEAIRDAARDIQELDTALGRNRLEEQKATTAQLEALERLNALKANPRATEVELRRARDAYDEQTQRIRELRDERARLTEEQEQANRLGVEGDERVIAARRRIADADERVARAREKRDLAEQQRDRERAEGARRIADAQRRVADARRDQDRQARQAAYQLAAATQAVETAQRSSATAAENMQTAGGAALEKMNEEMAELSPAAQQFARFIFGLKDEALALRAAAAENLLPGLQQAITELLPYLPGFTRFIGNIAGAMGALAVEAVRALGSPVWQRFFRYIDTEAVPALNQLFHTSMNFAEGLVALFLALTPFNRKVGTGLLELSEDFARWAEQLDQSQGYRNFLAYVQENGPKVIEFLKQLWELTVDLVQALAPIGSKVLSILTAVIDVLNSIPTGAMTWLLGAIAATAAGLIALSGVMKVVRLKRDIAEIFGPAQTRLVQRFAYDTGLATKETGRFRTALATTQGVAQATGQRLQFLGTAATRTRDGLGSLADTARGRFRQGIDAATVASAGFSTRMQGLAESTRGARNWVLYLGDDLRNATLTPALNAVGNAAQVTGQKMQVMGGHIQGARNYLSYLADDLARGPLGPQFVAAADAAQRFGTRVRDVGTRALSGMRTAATSLAGFMGGPWGIALAGATIAVGTLAKASADYNSKISSINASLDELGDKYRELERAGKLGGSEASGLLLQIAQSNPDMQQAVLNLDRMGVAVEDLGKAASGSRQDLEAILHALDAEIDVAGDIANEKSGFLFTGLLKKEGRAASDYLHQLRQLREAVKQHADEVKRAEQVQSIFNAQSKRHIGMAAIMASNTNATTAELAQMATEWDRNEIALQQVNQTLANFGDGAAAAARRADDLTKAIERQYGAAINANEANERWHAGLITLSESVASNGRTLDINTRAGQNNRNALQDVAQAARDMFIEEVRAGGELPKVTAKHADRIEKLREEARRLGLTRSETDKLIATYGEIDPSITTKYTTQNFPKVFEQAQKLRFAQVMLELGITDPKEAEAIWNRQQGAYPKGSDYTPSTPNYRMFGPAVPRASGGPINGPGTGTSDSILMWASNGEHVLTAAEVQAAGGHEAVYAWRKALLGGGEPPKYRIGGPVQADRKQGLPAYARGGAIAPFIVELGGTKLPSMAAIEDAVMSRIGLLGSGGGGQGWKWQMKVLREIFPGLTLISGYRPGAKTLDGSPSWHGKGRAVDLPPIRRVAEYIARTYGANTKELITPWRELMLYRGKPHKFSRRVEAQHGVFGNNRHIHWAFDDGGWLMPDMPAINHLRQPEPVLTPGQWDTIEDFVRQGMAGATGNTYQFEFRDTTLDAQKLRDMQAREDALARVGRGR